MTRISVGDIRLNVQSNGAGPPLILLHGFTGSTCTWDPFLTAFGQNFTAYRVDLPGHGLSDSPTRSARYRIERCVDDLLQLFGILGLEQVSVLGYSMGGRVALRLALDAPERVRSLVLESASPGIEGDDARSERSREDAALASMLQRDGLEAFIDYWERLPLFRTQAALPATTRFALRSQRLKNNPLGLANSLRGLGAGAAKPQWDRLEELTLPTLLITGALDEKYAALGERMASLMSSCRLVTIPGAGHAVHLEQPAAFQDLVMTFLNQPDEVLAPPMMRRQTAVEA